MKKGLLSLLAVALTVVSCQNYDDQFEELAGQITALQAQVTGLPDVTSQVTALANQIDALATAVAAIPDTDEATALLAAGLTPLQTQVEDIMTQLATVATSEELAAISSTIGDIEDDVHELLAAGNTIEGDLIITNPSQLLAATLLVDTDADSPNVTVIGDVIVDFGTGLTTQAQFDELQTVLNKLYVVAGEFNINDDSATISTTLSLPALVSVGSHYLVGIGATSKSVINDALISIGGDYELNIPGAVNLGVLVIGGQIEVQNTVSEIVLAGTVAQGLKTIGAPSSTLTQLASTTTIDTGDVPVDSVTAPGATAVTIGGATLGADLAIVINTPAALTIDVAATSVTNRSITITAGASTVLNFNGLTSTTGDISVTGSLESHFAALTSAGTINTGASGATNLSNLTALVGGANSIGGSTALVGSVATVASTATVAFPTATALDMPLAVISGAVTAPEAATVNAKSVASTNLIAVKAQTIILSEQAVSFTGDMAVSYPVLATLEVVGKTVAGLTTTEFVITSNGASLTTVHGYGMLDAFSVTSDSVDTVKTNGNITDLTLITSDLDALTLGHTYITGDTAATVVIDGSDLTSIDMSAITKVKTIDIQNNLVLATIVAPSSTVLAEDGAAISVTTANNSLTANYTNGADATPATETTPLIPAVAPVISSGTLKGLVDWFNANTASMNAGVSSTTSIDLDVVYTRADADSAYATASIDITAAFAADAYATANGYAGVIDNATERAAAAE